MLFGYDFVLADESSVRLEIWRLLSDIKSFSLSRRVVEIDEQEVLMNKF